MNTFIAAVTKRIEDLKLPKPTHASIHAKDVVVEGEVLLNEKIGKGIFWPCDPTILRSPLESPQLVDDKGYSRPVFKIHACPVSQIHFYFETEGEEQSRSEG